MTTRLITVLQYKSISKIKDTSTRIILNNIYKKMLVIEELYNISSRCLREDIKKEHYESYELIASIGNKLIFLRERMAARVYYINIINKLEKRLAIMKKGIKVAFRKMGRSLIRMRAWAVMCRKVFDTSSNYVTSVIEDLVAQNKRNRELEEMKANNKKYISPVEQNQPASTEPDFSETNIFIPNTQQMELMPDVY